MKGCVKLTHIQITDKRLISHRKDFCMLYVSRQGLGLYHFSFIHGYFKYTED